MVYRSLKTPTEILRKCPIARNQLKSKIRRGNLYHFLNLSEALINKVEENCFPSSVKISILYLNIPKKKVEKIEWQSITLIDFIILLLIFFYPLFLFIKLPILLKYKNTRMRNKQLQEMCRSKYTHQSIISSHTLSTPKEKRILIRKNKNPSELNKSSDKIQFKIHISQALSSRITSHETATVLPYINNKLHTHEKKFSRWE